MVSHDREFIDNIATSTIVLEGNGQLSEYVGGYSDYLKQSTIGKPSNDKKDKSPGNSKAAGKKEAAKSTAKLSYKFKRELDLLPVQIEKLEAKKEKFEAQLADPTTYQGDGSELGKLQDKYAELEKEIAVAYKRWDELESMNSD